MTVTVHAIDVYWADGFCNSPRLKFLVEGLPKGTEQVYEKRASAEETLAAEQVPVVGSRMRRKREGWHLYWSETDGFVWFFTWGGKPDDGFGGSRRTVKLTDGTEEEIIGGWHVGPSAAVDVGFPETMDISIVRKEEEGYARAWPRTGGLAMFITVERAKREIVRLRPDLEMTQDRWGGWTVKWAGQPSKDEWIETPSPVTGSYRKNHTSRERGDVYSALGPKAVAA